MNLSPLFLVLSLLVYSSGKNSKHRTSNAAVMSCHHQPQKKDNKRSSLWTVQQLMEQWHQKKKTNPRQSTITLSISIPLGLDVPRTAEALVQFNTQYEGRGSENKPDQISPKAQFIDEINQ